MIVHVLGRLRQKKWEFQASLGYREWILSQKLKRKTKQNKKMHDEKYKGSKKLAKNMRMKQYLLVRCKEVMSV
jgi:hypothetical protein